MRILIVEDELPAAERVVSLLHRSGFSVEILGITTGVESTVNWLSAHPQPDLILMDIQLEDGISFEIFEAIEVIAPVIFTTAYDVYALKAFSVNSIDYLLKPVDLPALQKALARYGQFFAPQKGVPEASSTEPGIENPFRIPDWRKLIEQLAPPRKERFLVKCGQKFRSVLASQTAFFHSAGGITFMKTFDGHSYDIDYTLEQLETVLNPATFFRVSRSHIIHADAVADMIPLSGSKMKIKVKSDLSPEGILVSRDRLQAFKRWMDK
jgi:DNA-binding LytR/AlgR family response regulator